MSRTPELKSFVVADHVLQEKVNDKWSIIGVFDRIYCREFPVIHASLGLFVKVADVQGTFPVKVEFRDSEDRCLAMFGGITVAAAGAPMPAAFGIQTYNLPLPHPGKYHFVLYFGAEVIGAIPIEAVMIAGEQP